VKIFFWGENINLVLITINLVPIL